MNEAIKAYLANLAIEELMQSKWGDKLKQAIALFESAQEHLYALADKKDEAEMTQVKAATVLVVSVLTKVSKGKSPTQFTADDWKSVVSDVSEYAILQDDQKYSEFVFFMYEKYIRFYGQQISIYASDEAVNSILSLADELKKKAKALNDGELSEVAYIEDCMWISLEAIVKLLASTAMRLGDSEYTRFAEALAMFAFEYGRLRLFRKEQELLDMYLVSQYALDKQLQDKYEAYIAELKKQSEQFMCLIDNAFAPDFRDAFLNSILLAQSVGVSNEEILSTDEDIDDFFLN